MVDPAFYHPTQDFRFARLEALREAVDDLLRQRPRLTSTYADKWTHVHIHERLDRGLESVPVYKIMGNAGRYADLDHSFQQSDRTEQIRRKVTQTQFVGNTQPPVHLYKINEV